MGKTEELWSRWARSSEIAMRDLKYTLIVAYRQPLGEVWRRETCDNCMGSRGYLPPAGQWEVDDAESHLALVKIICLWCALRLHGPGLASEILMAQGKRW